MNNVRTVFFILTTVKIAGPVAARNQYTEVPPTARGWGWHLGLPRSDTEKS